MNILNIHALENELLINKFMKKMKTNFLLMAVFTVIFVGISSCGSNKNVGASPHGELVRQTECEKLREKSPVNRVVGNGQHFRESIAINQAELQARTSFSRMIETSIKASTTFAGNDLTMYAGDDNEGRSVTDQSVRGNDFAESLTKQIVRNLVNIKTEKYILPNKQYNVYVCLEYRGNVADMAREIAQTANRMISDEDKLKINFELDRYQKDIEEKLNNYKGY